MGGVVGAFAWLLSSEVFLLVPRILDTAGLFLSDRVRMLRPVLVFGGMSIQMGFSYCVRMKKTEVEDGRVQVSREDEEEWSRRQRG
ncbi:hypothetical protein CK203_006042 [Vitis vinifera]|uniref:Uncharacterized protein n=1 Tax=Vitis vinifera TaxID=29760 RepID=A0A438K6J5_VITVI|nr:hypothetical protein CK203_006042 [Vitis vinifera]